MNFSNNNKIIPSLLLMGLTLSSGLQAQGSFDGHNINVKFELWETDGQDNIISVKGVTNEQNIIASDAVIPDARNFHAILQDLELWNIDFNQQVIELTFTSIQVQDNDHQFMYGSSVGFHFQDIDGNLGDIVNVTVDNSNAPFGFNPELVRFDADNIYVNLKGSMCHVAGMGSMPTCTNPLSPTGYDNQIKLIVDLAGTVPPVGTDNSRIDALYSWAEREYSQYFPSQQTSFELSGYHARHYPETNNYLGTKDGHLFIYGEQFGGLQDLGDVETWLNDLSL
jgi:hypothetical protein